MNIFLPEDDTNIVRRGARNIKFTPPHIWNEFMPKPKTGLKNSFNDLIEKLTFDIA